MTDCWIALGGNVGDVAETFARALDALGRVSGISVVSRSRNYTTSAVGTNAGQRFVNAAAHLTSQLDPFRLLDTLQDVETQLGRVRRLRWGPRTLDLDLLFHGQQVVSTPRLTVPHPHVWYRRFALDPLVEVSPDLIHPQHGISVSQLREKLLVRPLPCQLYGGDATERMQLETELAASFPETTWNATPVESNWLAFKLGHEADERGTAARVITLSNFPTPPHETVRDVLQAALHAALPID